MQSTRSLRATVAMRMAAMLVLVSVTASAGFAGPADEARQIAALAGFHGGLVWAAASDASTGSPAPQLGLPRMGANGLLFLSLADGRLVCLGPP